MRSQDLGSVFTACPDDTLKGTSSSGCSVNSTPNGLSCRSLLVGDDPTYNPHARRTKAGSSSSRTDARLKSHAVRHWIEACFREVGLDWDDYADSVDGRIPYYDITAFRESDGDLAAEFLEIERRERNNKPSYPG